MYGVTQEKAQRPPAISPTKEWQSASEEEHRREPEYTGWRRADVRVESKVTEEGLPGWRRAVAAIAASESSGCMSMNDMADLDQSVLMKSGRVLSYRRRRGSERS